LASTASMNCWEKRRFCSAFSASSSSIVSAMRHSRYALPTTRCRPGGSCGIVNAKVRETPWRMCRWYSSSARALSAFVSGCCIVTQSLSPARGPRRAHPVSASVRASRPGTDRSCAASCSRPKTSW
jgi:hypothetical protein